MPGQYLFPDRTPQCDFNARHKGGDHWTLKRWLDLFPSKTLFTVQLIEKQLTFTIFFFFQF